MKRIIVYIVLLLGVASCGTCVFDRQITGYYYLLATDSMEDLSVCYIYCTGVALAIGGKGVYEVGNDEHFIITKKYKEVPRPGRDSLFTTYDKSITLLTIRENGNNMIQKQIVKLKAIVNKNSMRHLSYRIDLMKEIGSTWVVLWMLFPANHYQ